MSEFFVILAILAVIAGIIEALWKSFPPLAILVFMAVLYGVWLKLNSSQQLAKIELAKKETEAAELAARQEAERAEKEAAKLALLELEREAELRVQKLRDADVQAEPYTYEIDNHGNESLAIRYGIANLEERTKEYWYFDRGGVRKRNPARDSIERVPATMMRLQKVRSVGNSKYEVLLTDYRNRHAIAVIEPGTEYIKTFLPMNDEWFKKHADLEMTLKGNGSFTLKELATFHVQKTIGR